MKELTRNPNVRNDAPESIMLPASVKNQQNEQNGRLAQRDALTKQSESKTDPNCTNQQNEQNGRLAPRDALTKQSESKTAPNCTNQQKGTAPNCTNQQKGTAPNCTNQQNGTDHNCTNQQKGTAPNRTNCPPAIPANLPPAMPANLPPLIQLLTKNVPDIYKPAVANAVFPALGAHLHGVKFRYWDNVDHEATFMNVLIGRQSIGKGCIKKPIEYIMEDIRQRDIPNRQREAEWKQNNPHAKKQKDPRPTDICIQMLIDNLTDAVFNQRLIDAHNNGQRYIYTIVDEIEALKRVTSKGSADEVGLLIRKAFDNSLAGQERVGPDSVSGIAPLRWNFNASTTPPNARRFFGRMVNDGTISRLDISTIIRPDDDDETAPILGLYDNSFADELKPYIDRLESANGLIECPDALALALQIRQENSENARLNDSQAYRILSYRANVIAWLKGMVLYVAGGNKWDKSIEEFVRWTNQYNLWCKMLYFGQQLERELQEEVEIQHKSTPQNLLNLLPDEFTREQYRQMRTRQGCTTNGDSTLRTWGTRGYIRFDDTTGFYCKTPAYKQKYAVNS